MLTRTDRQRHLWGWGWGLPALFLLSFIIAWACLGCQSNPVSIAKTPLQRAYAVYGEFVIAEEEGAALKRSGSVPVALNQAIARADAVAKPAADALLRATLEYNAAVRALAVGNSTPEKLKITQANLEHWIKETRATVYALVAVIKGT